METEKDLRVKALAWEIEARCQDGAAIMERLAEGARVAAAAVRALGPILANALAHARIVDEIQRRERRERSRYWRRFVRRWRA